MSAAVSRGEAWGKLHDPATSAHELAAIAAEHAEFAQAIAAHPNAYPGLQEWAANLVAAAAPAAISAQTGFGESDFGQAGYGQAAAAPGALAKLPRLITPLGITAVVLLSLNACISYILGAAYFNFWAGGGPVGDWVEVLMDFWPLTFAAFGIAIGVLVWAPTPARKFVALLCLVLPPALINFSMMPYSLLRWLVGSEFLSDLIYSQWTYLLLHILAGAGFSAAFVIARPVRGYGWIPIPVLALLAGVLGLLVPATSWLATVCILIMIVAIVLADVLSGVSERRAQRSTEQLRLGVRHNSF